jgi:regulator of replication initiation timing
VASTASAWPIEMIRGIFGRVILKLRIDSLDRMMARATKINNSLKSTMAQLHASNQQLAAEVSRIENENNELRQLVDHLQKITKKIDPNAKCPNCGHCEGHLSHTWYDNQVRVVNNCHVCQYTFISAEPVAGAQAAAAAHQETTERINTKL